MSTIEKVCIPILAAVTLVGSYLVASDYLYFRSRHLYGSGLTGSSFRDLYLDNSGSVDT